MSKNPPLAGAVSGDGVGQRTMEKLLRVGGTGPAIR